MSISTFQALTCGFWVGFGVGCLYMAYVNVWSHRRRTLDRPRPDGRISE